jgi:2-polyprenyl-3-methyl-5-hydroxy-6-metoxy-1,4-benzoquinol methylase
MVSLECHACGGAVPLHLEAASEDLLCPHCRVRYAYSDGGILVVPGPADPAVEDDYPPAVYALLAEVEPAHFWFDERNRLILSTMREVLGSLQDRTVVDIGCGTGFVTAAAERAGMRTCGLEAHLGGLRIARTRTRGQLLCETAMRMPFAGQFDVAMLCDVIEHTPDDVGVLRAASSAVQPAGIVVVTVPAHQWLWSPLDDVSGHKRRYSRRTLIDAMHRAGLRVRLARYFNCLLLPAQMAHRLLASARERKLDRLALLRRGLMPPREPWNALMRLAMRADGVLSRFPLNFGASLVAIGVR